jgi:hypothetical protein
MKFWSFEREHILGSLGVHFKDYQFSTDDKALIQRLLENPSRGKYFDVEKEDGSMPDLLGPTFLRRHPVPVLDMDQARRNKDMQIMHEKARPTPTLQDQFAVETPEERIERELAASQERKAARPGDTFEYGINGKPWRQPEKAEYRLRQLFKKDGIPREVVENPKGSGYCIRKIME